MYCSIRDLAQMCFDCYFKNKANCNSTINIVANQLPYLNKIVWCRQIDNLLSLDWWTLKRFYK